MTKPVYLDHNATAPVRPEAADAVVRALAIAGNPSSVHAGGRAARRVIEEARESVAALCGAPSAERVVFTSGGTEANALALRGVDRMVRLVSAIEHPSVFANAGAYVAIPVTGAGIVDLESLETLLAETKAPALVSVMAANNETGLLQPVAKVAALAHAHGALFHCDMVQAAGRTTLDMSALDMSALGIDLLTLSAHKLGGPKGVGALVLGEGVEVAPLIVGGGQERRRRAGTENLPGIAGFAAAADAARTVMEAESRRLKGLRDDLERRALAAVPWAVAVGRGHERLDNTACLALPGVPAETQVMALDLEGVMVSAGAACSSGKVTRSHVLDAMGLAPEIAGSAVRVSLGWTTVQADTDRFIEVWGPLAHRLSGRAVRTEVPLAAAGANR